MTTSLATVRFIGTDHWFAVQLYELSVLIPKVQASFVVYETKGCRKVELMLPRSSSPANDQMWFASTPTVHGPICLSATPVGPAPHLPPPRRSSVAVGIRATGP